MKQREALFLCGGWWLPVGLGCTGQPTGTGQPAGCHTSLQLSKFLAEQGVEQCMGVPMAHRNALNQPAPGEWQLDRCPRHTGAADNHASDIPMAHCSDLGDR